MHSGVVTRGGFSQIEPYPNGTDGNNNPNIINKFQGFLALKFEPEKNVDCIVKVLIHTPH
jgi:hypothetical protein